MTPPCQHCTGCCCRQSWGHTYAVILTPVDLAFFDSYSVLNSDQDKVLPYVDGKCIFLSEDNLCEVYEKRPELCRKFSCTNGYNLKGEGMHSFFLEDNPHVVSLIEQYCLIPPK